MDAFMRVPLPAGGELCPHSMVIVPSRRKEAAMFADMLMPIFQWWTLIANVGV